MKDKEYAEPLVTKIAGFVPDNAARCIHKNGELPFSEGEYLDVNVPATLVIGPGQVYTESEFAAARSKDKERISTLEAGLREHRQHVRQAYMENWRSMGLNIEGQYKKADEQMVKYDALLNPQPPTT